MPQSRPPNAVPAGGERSAWVTWFTSRGWRGQELAAAIAPGRTRRQMTDELVALQRQAGQV